MELERSHFRTSSTCSSTATTTATASELFICFASRLSSSSSMKFTKSILSPGRARDGSISLTASLSRRLRTNGSLKGGQASPFLSNAGKKRGCAFENPEPSSPKVTCIGQVRVKTKKKVKRKRSLSRIERNEEKICVQQYQNQPGQELPHRNQRWVHLPVTICESLKAFGAEFSCLFPCKSSCFSTCEREKAEKQNGSRRNEDEQSSCGAVFARWLVSLNDGEGGRKREIELVVGDGDEEEREQTSIRSSRRHVFEDIEIKDNRIEVKGQVLGEEEEAGRVSICLPPKNALLLMRCRSDPMKMAALANRFSWDTHSAPRNEDMDEEEEENEGKEDGDELEDVEEQTDICDIRECQDQDEVFMVKEPHMDEIPLENVPASVEFDEEQVISSGEETNLVMEGAYNEEGNEEGGLQISSEEVPKETEKEELHEVEEDAEALVEEKEEIETNMSSFEALLDQGNTEDYSSVQEKEQVKESPILHSPLCIESDKEEEIASNEELAILEEAALKKEQEQEQEQEQATAEESNVETQAQEIIFQDSEENPTTAQLNFEPENPEKIHLEDAEQKTIAPPIESETENQELSTEPHKKDKEAPVLPDCLLLMMCEPKLSMEVSKETWVCSTDFLRWLPERPSKATADGTCCHHYPIKKRLSIDSKLKPITHPAPQTQSTIENNHQPRRSSCSLPSSTAVSKATVIEQKLVNAVTYEPFELTRCKSEPMSTAAAKLMPVIEPHRRTGAAGVGF